MFQKLKKITAINFPIKLVSVIIAIVLWTIVLGSRSIEVTKELPLQVVLEELVKQSQTN